MMRIPKTIWVVLVSIATVLLPLSTAIGAVITTGGAVQVTAPLSDVRPNQTQNDDIIWLFTEQTNYVLPSPLTVNITAPGSYSSYPSSLVSTLPAGMRVDVYFMHFDPVHSRRRQGYVKFNTPILGVIVRNAQLLSSNFLGVPGTQYPTSGSLLALENGDDKINLPDMTELHVDWLASSPGDRIRIITAAIPEPSTMLLFALGLAGASMRLRKRA